MKRYRVVIAAKYRHEVDRTYWVQARDVRGAEAAARQLDDERPFASIAVYHAP